MLATPSDDLTSITVPKYPGKKQSDPNNPILNVTEMSSLTVPVGVEEPPQDVSRTDGWGGGYASKWSIVFGKKAIKYIPIHAIKDMSLITSLLFTEPFPVIIDIINQVKKPISLMYDGDDIEGAIDFISRANQKNVREFIIGHKPGGAVVIGVPERIGFKVLASDTCRDNLPEYVIAFQKGDHTRILREPTDTIPTDTIYLQAFHGVTSISLPRIEFLEKFHMTMVDTTKRYDGPNILAINLDKFKYKLETVPGEERAAWDFRESQRKRRNKRQQYRQNQHHQNQPEERPWVDEKPCDIRVSLGIIMKFIRDSGLEFNVIAIDGYPLDEFIGEPTLLSIKSKNEYDLPESIVARPIQLERVTNAINEMQAATVDGGINMDIKLIPTKEFKACPTYGGIPLGPLDGSINLADHDKNSKREITISRGEYGYEVFSGVPKDKGKWYN